VQIVPGVALALPGGHVADQFDRRKVLITSMSLLLLCSLGLMLASMLRRDVWLMYVCLFFIGVARAFLQPAKSALMPQIVPREMFSNAVTWNGSAFQFAAITGPALAGWLIAATDVVWVVYLLDALGIAFFILTLLAMRPRPVVRTKEPVTLRSLAAGFKFVWSTKVVLAAMTLDMFAVLLGGATALIPVYASRHVLDVGPTGLGWLNAAPAVGAILISVWLAHRPPIKRAGPALLWSVVGFGAVTIVFGFSRWYWLSLLALFLTGLFDMISVVIRHTLVQIMAPDEMRGRVSAVNGIFIGLSNELGAFESGAVAKAFDRRDDPAFGPTISVVTGGLGTIAVVALVTMLMPQVRRFGRLDLAHEQRDESPGTCAGCGYDLRNLPAGKTHACPECGLEFALTPAGTPASVKPQS
jgi:MFS family permease